MYSSRDKFQMIMLVTGFITFLVITLVLLPIQTKSEEVEIDLINEKYANKEIGHVKRNRDKRFNWDLKIEFADGGVAFISIDCKNKFKKEIEECKIKELK